MLKERKLEVEKRVISVIEKMGAEVVRTYECCGGEDHPDSISIYFEYRYCMTKRKIRISDHTKQHKDSPLQKDLKSFTFVKGSKLETVERFVKNRINAIKKRAIWDAFRCLQTA